MSSRPPSRLEGSFMFVLSASMTTAHTSERTAATGAPTRRRAHEPLFFSACLRWRFFCEWWFSLSRVSRPATRWLRNWITMPEASPERRMSNGDVQWTTPNQNRRVLSVDDDDFLQRLDRLERMGAGDQYLTVAMDHVDCTPEEVDAARVAWMARREGLLGRVGGPKPSGARSRPAQLEESRAKGERKQEQRRAFVARSGSLVCQRRQQLIPKSRGRRGRLVQSRHEADGRRGRRAPPAKSFPAEGRRVTSRRVSRPAEEDGVAQRERPWHATLVPAGAPKVEARQLVVDLWSDGLVRIGLLDERAAQRACPFAVHWHERGASCAEPVGGRVLSIRHYSFSIYRRQKNIHFELTRAHPPAT